jgi:hypothetical protein
MLPMQRIRSFGPVASDIVVLQLNPSFAQQPDPQKQSIFLTHQQATDKLLQTAQSLLINVKPVPCNHSLIKSI